MATEVRMWIPFRERECGISPAMKHEKAQYTIENDSYCDLGSGWPG